MTDSCLGVGSISVSLGTATLNSCTLNATTASLGVQSYPAPGEMSLTSLTSLSFFSHFFSFSLTLFLFSLSFPLTVLARLRAPGSTERGLLSLTTMDVPGNVLADAMAQLRGIGSSLTLSEATVPEWDADPLAGTLTVTDDCAGQCATKTAEPADLLAAMPQFVVVSGPCTVSDGGMCVGRAAGYLRGERCSIAVGAAADGGSTSTLSACSVFDTELQQDRVTIARQVFAGSDCPEGQQVTLGDEVQWQSDSGRTCTRNPSVASDL